MKVLFLDIDGVLNSAEYMRERRHIRRPTQHAIDAVAVPRLNAIIERTSCEIVVSSTWRLGDPQEHITPTNRMQWILSTHGVIGEVIGCTPYLVDQVGDGPMVVQRERGCEIQAWLDAWHSEPVETFVILDDGSDMAHLRDRLVQTTWERGLLDEHVERVVALLADDAARARGE